MFLLFLSAALIYQQSQSLFVNTNPSSLSAGHTLSAMAQLWASRHCSQHSSDGSFRVCLQSCFPPSAGYGSMGSCALQRVALGKRNCSLVPGPMKSLRVSPLPSGLCPQCRNPGKGHGIEGLGLGKGSVAHQWSLAMLETPSVWSAQCGPTPFPSFVRWMCVMMILSLQWGVLLVPGELYWFLSGAKSEEQDSRDNCHGSFGEEKNFIDKPPIKRLFHDASGG